MDRDEWLAERRSGIGGSDAAAALGLSKWKTRYQLWQEKRGEVIDTPDNWSMRWGRTMEPELRQHYSDVTGRAVLLTDGLIRHPKYPWMLATPDGGTEDRRIVEIKTSRSTDGWGPVGTDMIPQHYLIQVQHYLCVTGFEVADVVLGIYGQEPMLYEVPADAELQEMIVDGEREFWRYVESGEPPEPVSYADVIARYGRSSSANAVVADTDALETIAQLRALQAQAEELSDSIELRKAALMRLLGDNDTLVDENGRVLCTWKAAKPSMRLDSKALQAAHPELYKQFTKAGESSRRFLLKG